MTDPFDDSLQRQRSTTQSRGCVNAKYTAIDRRPPIKKRRPAVHDLDAVRGSAACGILLRIVIPAYAGIQNMESR
jgi:hypothetical protein